LTSTDACELAAPAGTANMSTMSRSTSTRAGRVKKYGPIAPTQCQRIWAHDPALAHPLQRTRKRRSLELGMPPILR
jgi:hypothetical protein